MRKITVHRKGYVRSDGTRVAPTVFQIEDRGAKGKGEEVIHVKRGKMTDYAIRLRYISPGQRISDIPNDRIDDFARELASLVGVRSALGMFQSQITFRRLQENRRFKKKMMIAAKAVSTKAANTPLRVRKSILTMNLPMQASQNQ
jgi:hypothetical protein